jgi:hypothetical protein
VALLPERVGELLAGFEFGDRKPGILLDGGGTGRGDGRGENLEAVLLLLGGELQLFVAGDAAAGLGWTTPLPADIFWISLGPSSSVWPMLSLWASLPERT